MEHLYLTIHMPRIDGENAAAIQNFLYALVEAFDAQFCHLIEQYYNADKDNLAKASLLDDSTDNQEPF